MEIYYRVFDMCDDLENVKICIDINEAVDNLLNISGFGKLEIIAKAEKNYVLGQYSKNSEEIIGLLSGKTLCLKANNEDVYKIRLSR